PRTTTIPAAAARAIPSATNRVLPAPASPTTSTSRTSPPSAPSSRDNSPSRPTKPAGPATFTAHQPEPLRSTPRTGPVGSRSTQHGHRGLQDLSIAGTGKVAAHPGQRKRHLADVVAEHGRQATVADIPVDEQLEVPVVVQGLRDLGVS